MKRFLLFEGYHYYPQGGWDDFVKDFDTFEEAKQSIETSNALWNHIVDLETGESEEIYDTEKMVPISKEEEKKLCQSLVDKGYISFRKEGE